MAFWVPPFSDPNRQAEYACRAALEQLALLDAFNRRVPDIVGLRRDVPSINFRAGLSTGEVVVGSVGSETARSFTVMGDTVNQASRLEAANKVYGTNVLIDHETYAAAGLAIETESPSFELVMFVILALSHLKKSLNLKFFKAKD